MKSLLVKDRNELTKAENKICDYIEEYMNSSIYMTVTEIANNCGVGEATVTRFCRKLGFRSFLEFKMTMAQEFKNNGYNNADISDEAARNEVLSEDDSLGEFVKKFYDMNISSLENTLKKIDYTIIEEISDILVKAKRIAFAGVGHSGLIAEDAYYKFMKVGLACNFYRDSHTLLMMASLMKEDDVLFIISNSGNTEEVNMAAEIARENNVRVISITENLLSKLARVSDYVLNYTYQEIKLDMESLGIRISQSFLVDLICTNVIRKNKEIAIESKIKTENAIKRISK
ncbi:MurR/RpiR family transcriptional regulator [Clostridium sp. AL.422]|uniref:MurR/RpiR family transcriptional regulator n=1 Tax=Clostridium TaxID=1485 RepID=UPI00293DD3E8|nr:MULTISPECIES: MurR/RpiR family transcriptional regulator [unclassified Clostridium]MDV4151087.1 MurR/RpiR family transcriptional regulator [Clostridium sp. AL.422]